MRRDQVRCRQCDKCPWKKSTDPHEIPNGYDVDLHRGLERTINSGLQSLHAAHMMACHESPVGSEQACVGWLYHQLGPGNNLRLRLIASSGLFADVQWPEPETQHETFEDTLPEGADG